MRFQGFFTVFRTYLKLHRYACGPFPSTKYFSMRYNSFDMSNVEKFSNSFTFHFIILHKGSNY